MQAATTAGANARTAAMNPTTKSAYPLGLRRFSVGMGGSFVTETHNNQRCSWSPLEELLVVRQIREFDNADRQWLPLAAA